MKGFIVLLLILVLGALGYMIYEREIEKRRIQKETDVAQRIQQAVTRQMAEWDAEVEKAILERRVIRGMMSYHVHKAWGRPHSTGRMEVDAKWRALGVYEIWEFNQGFLGMSVDGKVLGLGTWTN